MKKILVILVVLIGLVKPVRVKAKGEVLGMHIMQPEEVVEVRQLFDDDQWRYVTIPYSVDDRNPQKWQDFFNNAREKKLIPLLRLTTRFNGQVWEIPTRYDVVKATTFLSQLDWPNDQKHVILFNEPNQATEWGGEIDPQEYGHLLEFAADWLHTENKNFVVLPAGLDAAARDTNETQDSFRFLGAMLTTNPELINKIDAWVSHSYPNPGFTSSAFTSGKSSIAGFKNELDFLRKYSNKEFKVYITETGWKNTGSVSRRLVDYYRYAINTVWHDDRVVAVTPFIWQGAPGMFAEFSFLNPDGSPTPQFEAVREIIDEDKGV
jgi:hypothetical protein